MEESVAEAIGLRKKSFKQGVVEVKNYTTFAAPYEGEVIEERGSHRGSK
jgi:hypothetical protein